MKRALLIAAFVAVTIAAVILFRKLMNAQRMSAPVQGNVTSPFGDRTHPVTGSAHFHNGVDYAVPEGTDVLAPFDGTVRDILNNSTGGLQLIIDHTNGYRTGYAHLSETLVKNGDQVKKGQRIALTGSSGRVTGPHLHFTMRGPDGEYVDPLTHLA